MTSEQAITLTKHRLEEAKIFNDNRDVEYYQTVLKALEKVASLDRLNRIGNR